MKLQGDSTCGLRQPPTFFRKGRKTRYAPELYCEGGECVVTYSDLFQLVIAVCSVISAYILIKNSDHKEK